jgi:hypothetical protein
LLETPQPTVVQGKQIPVLFDKPYGWNVRWIDASVPKPGGKVINCSPCAKVTTDAAFGAARRKRSWRAERKMWLPAISTSAASTVFAAKSSWSRYASQINHQNKNWNYLR